MKIAKVLKCFHLVEVQLYVPINQARDRRTIIQRETPAFLNIQT